MTAIQDRLKESRTGVYTGISNDEYRMLVVESAKPSEAAGCLYALSGTNLNGASGRVSFVLGLKGPAKAVDAACASALVAIHDAVADLQPRPRKPSATISFRKRHTCCNWNNRRSVSRPCANSSIPS